MSRLTTGDPVAAAVVGSGARPTACCNDSPGATDTVAPGREAAASASCGLTARVAEPLWTAAGASMSACACAGGSGRGEDDPCDSRAQARDRRQMVYLHVHPPRVAWTMRATVALPDLTIKMAKFGVS